MLCPHLWPILGGKRERERGYSVILSHAVCHRELYKYIWVLFQSTKMQQEGGVGSRGRTPAERRLSLLLQDLEYQLNRLSASLVEPPRTRTPYREEAFTSIDTTKHWAIQSPLDEYHEEPQER